MENSIGEGINEATRIVIEDNYQEDEETIQQGRITNLQRIN